MPGGSSPPVLPSALLTRSSPRAGRRTTRRARAPPRSCAHRAGARDPRGTRGGEPWRYAAARGISQRGEGEAEGQGGWWAALAVESRGREARHPPRRSDG
eukprot:scaffold21224_cov61-Phaeocystis_antarctica.AAC.2